MPIVIEEDIQSRALVDSRSYELRYKLTGTEDAAEALSALKAQASLICNGLSRGDCRVELIEGCTSRWIGVVPYEAGGSAVAVPLSVGSTSIRFRSGGGSTRVYQSLSTSGTYPAAGVTAPDFKKAIGVHRDGQVEGVEIGSSAFEFSITKAFPESTITDTYIGTLRDLANTVNDSAFKGLAAGECRFLGAEGGRRSDGADEITFNFSVIKNRSDIEIGSIDGISKKGWDYLWVYYQEKMNVDTGGVKPDPAVVYVEKVYHDGNFALLGI